MRRFLVGVDFSERSARAEAQALALAAAAGADLKAVHVIDAEAPARLASAARDEAAARAAAWRARGAEAGVSCSLITAQGEAHVELPRFAREVGADCVILGAHRRSPERNAFIGTTADRILRASGMPVLVVRRNEAAAYRSALVAIDFDAPDFSPLRAALDLGIVTADRATAAFGVETERMRRMKREAASFEAIEQAFAAEEPPLRAQAEGMLRAAGFSSVAIMMRPVLLNAADLVFSMASAARADLLALGSRRKGAEHRQPLGSVSETVLRRAEIDVLVVPAG
ncbi:MAG: universal stress protein [Parvularculaceae bacterium]